MSSFWCTLNDISLIYVVCNAHITKSYHSLLLGIDSCIIGSYRDFTFVSSFLLLSICTYPGHNMSVYSVYFMCLRSKENVIVCNNNGLQGKPGSSDRITAYKVISFHSHNIQTAGSSRVQINSKQSASTIQGSPLYAFACCSVPSSDC